MPNNKETNIARIVYDAYPDSNLLPIDPEQDCQSLQTLLAQVNAENIGDGLFRFLIVEIVEGGESTMDGAIQVLERAKADVDAVLYQLRLESAPCVSTVAANTCARNHLDNWQFVWGAGIKVNWYYKPFASPNINTHENGNALGAAKL